MLVAGKMPPALLMGLIAAATAAHPPLRIEPWGKNGIRVRQAPEGRAIYDAAPGALGSSPPIQSPGTPAAGGAGTSVTNGELDCSVDAEGRLHFSRGGELLLSEAEVRMFGNTPYSGVSNLSISFALSPGERIWGLGQVESNLVDASGNCYDTAPQNGHIVIPLAHSSKGVSFLLNLPSYGTVCVDAHGKADRRFTWHSRGAFNFDLWVTAAAVGVPALPANMQAYVEATGRPTPFPYWATGFWQSKNRYRSTGEVLGIAKQYRALGIPLSMIVIDEGAWDLLGNEGWGGCSNGSITATGAPCPCFGPGAAEMVKQLSAMNIAGLQNLGAESFSFSQLILRTFY